MITVGYGTGGMIAGNGCDPEHPPPLTSLPRRGCRRASGAGAVSSPIGRLCPRLFWGCVYGARRISKLLGLAVTCPARNFAVCWIVRILGVIEHRTINNRQPQPSRHQCLEFRHPPAWMCRHRLIERPEATEVERHVVRLVCCNRNRSIFVIVNRINVTAKIVVVRNLNCHGFARNQWSAVCRVTRSPMYSRS